MILFRLVKVAYVLISTGVLWKSKNSGERLIVALNKLGPSFIKLGQALSVRPDVIGAKMAMHLSQLQDRVPPFDYQKARKIIESELEKPVDELFLQFDDKPVAAASIAQVHKATTMQGVDVAVKIVRPNVEKAFKRDIKLFYTFARLLDKFESFKRLKAIEIVELLDKMAKRELDLRFEAASASKLRSNTKHDVDFNVPEIMWQLTSTKILTLQWVEGIPIGNIEELKKAGHNLREISEKVAVSFFNQTYRDGFFHADMHPGNLFVGKNGEIIPVDFGIMGNLDHSTRLFVAQILKGFLDGDYDKVAQIHFQAGYVSSDKSLEDFAIACRVIGEPILGLPANQISIAKLLSLLFKITEDFEMETQPQLLMFQKTMVLIEGVGGLLYQDMNMWQLAEPWIKNWAKENLGTKAKVKYIQQELNRVLLSLPENLNNFEQLIETYQTKGLKLHPETIKKLKSKECPKKSPLCHISLWAIFGTCVWLLLK